MRRLLLILALVLPLAAACSVASVPRAEAAALTGMHRIGAAVDGMRVVEPAHCRPGRRHHHIRPYDGCRKVERRRPAVVQPSPPPAPRGNWGFQHNGSFGSLFER